DINEFKVYNDIYGFEKGDYMIRYLADMLIETVKKAYPYSSFIGHVGGDDFIMLLTGDIVGYHKICRTIIAHFEKEKDLFFNRDHLESGIIKSEDRFGVMRSLSLTSLSIAGIFGDLGEYSSVESLTETLASIKKEVKKAGQSAYKLESVLETLNLAL
ncbi:MAG TPA: histidine kinase, partial [Clostridiales bacterium UBA8960]|nr:histidine kinase [Clostridiales bacterium UBA8960]